MNFSRSIPDGGCHRKFTPAMKCFHCFEENIFQFDEEPNEVAKPKHLCILAKKTKKFSSPISHLEFNMNNYY